MKSNQWLRQSHAFFSKKNGDIVLPRSSGRGETVVGVIRVTGRNRGIGRSEGLCVSGAKGGRRLGRTEAVSSLW